MWFWIVGLGLVGAWHFAGRRGSASGGGYAWVPGEVQGRLDTPQDGDSVYAVAIDNQGQEWEVLISAEAIDGAGNFVGTVQDNGGFEGIQVGQELTVPLAAISWIVGR